MKRYVQERCPTPLDRNQYGIPLQQSISYMFYVPVARSYQTLTVDAVSVAGRQAGRGLEHIAYVANI